MKSIIHCELAKSGLLLFLTTIENGNIDTDFINRLHRIEDDNKKLIEEGKELSYGKE